MDYADEEKEVFGDEDMPLAAFSRKRARGEDAGDRDYRQQMLEKFKQPVVS